MAQADKWVMIPSPAGPFSLVDPAARLVFGLIWNRCRLSARNVLKGDSRWCDDLGRVYCVYSHAELAEHSGMTDRTVRRCLKTLEDHGILTWEKSDFRAANKYFVSGLVRAYLAPAVGKKDNPQTPAQ